MDNASRSNRFLREDEDEGTGNPPVSPPPATMTANSPTPQPQLPASSALSPLLPLLARLSSLTETFVANQEEAVNGALNISELEGYIKGGVEKMTERSEGY